MVHIVESTIGRRYGGWFIKNTEHSQRVFDNLRASPLPISKVVPAVNGAAAAPVAESAVPATSTKSKVAWAK